MSGFSVLHANAIPFLKANVDTDQLLPKQFLTGVTRTGYGKHLFHDWRYIDVAGTQAAPEFILNNPLYSGAQILLAGENVGCGSSREHAPWALADFGLNVIIAPSFADIFYGNCINNLLLPIVLNKEDIQLIAARVEARPDIQISIDLSAQTVSLGDLTFEFSIERHHKENLMSGRDMIDQSLMFAPLIHKHEETLPDWLS
ncbi:3-isopropylmalate dehydratase small subunit [Paraglaciecola chathamensis]|uniref:3-isopropylmalate dehydratase small subunit n=1 Tax=Paraglaciecola chathamensis TaxID=368405 RepID=UPI00270B7C72|nr:3-isopropylmalate dehydratase small subunit [Paraglaciecola chathamensis]MDO6839163.1 3-isopropylmalate dehydratase small subunit [Paraglaciecola chathamensis]